jgi:peptidoglycan/LPS O-acetylase OafA/YrhL
LTTPSAAGAARPPARVAVLDGLRAVAILGVLAYHYCVRWTPPNADVDLYPYHGFFARWPVLNYGWAGVELFFVISGFVICMTLERSNGILDFARRRLARLWPAMLVCASLTMLVAHFGPDQWKTNGWGFVSSILFIDPDLFSAVSHHTALGWVDGVYWTLWIEVRFYVLAAEYGEQHRRRFLAGLSVLMLVSFLAGLRMADYPYRDWAQLWLLPNYLPYFVFGAGLHRLSDRGRLEPGTALVTALSVVCIFAQGWLSFHLPTGQPWGLAIANGLIVCAFILFVTGSPLMAPFGWRPLAKLGEASYSLYLIHSVVGLVLVRLLSEVMPWPFALLGVTAFMIALALLLFRWVETPGKRLILKLTALPWLMPRGLIARVPFAGRRMASRLPSTLPNG